MKINEGTVENAEENMMEDYGKEEEGKELQEQPTEEEAEEKDPENIIQSGYKSDSDESIAYSSHIIEGCCRSQHQDHQRYYQYYLLTCH